MDDKYDIFISYRRNGGYETAKHIYDRLNFDRYKVSFDIDTLRSGDFDTQLLSRIDECTDFILILNPGALDRCEEQKEEGKNDWVRQELAYALKQNKNIIPIMLPGFNNFPDNLPEDISAIAKKNGPPYSKEYFDNFYDRLKQHFILSSPKKIAEDFQVKNKKEAIVRIYAEKDCYIYRFGEYIGQYHSGEYFPLKLRRGVHVLKFLSLDNSEAIEKEYTVEDVDFEDILRIEFKQPLKKSTVSLLIEQNSGDFLFFSYDEVYRFLRSEIEFIKNHKPTMEELKTLFERGHYEGKYELENFYNKYLTGSNKKVYSSFETCEDYVRLISLSNLRNCEAMSLSIFYLSSFLSGQYYCQLRREENGKAKDLYLECGDGVFDIKGTDRIYCNEGLPWKKFVVRDKNVFQRSIFGGLWLTHEICDGKFKDLLLLCAFPFKVTIKYEGKDLLNIAPWTIVPSREIESFEIKKSRNLQIGIEDYSWNIDITKIMGYLPKKIELTLAIDSDGIFLFTFKDQSTNLTKYWMLEGYRIT